MDHYHIALLIILCGVLVLLFALKRAVVASFDSQTDQQIAKIHSEGHKVIALLVYRQRHKCSLKAARLALASLSRQ